MIWEQMRCGCILNALRLVTSRASTRGVIGVHIYTGVSAES